MKRPVWRYSLEVESNAPLALVRAKLESMADALPLSVFAPRLGGRGPRAWRQDQFQPLVESEGWLRRAWTARLGGLQEEAEFRVQATDQGCRLRAHGKVKGWPLLWKVGLLGWRSEALLLGFIKSLP